MAAAAPSVAAADTCGIRPVTSPNTKLAVTMAIHNTVIAIKTIPLIVLTPMRQEGESMPLAERFLDLFGCRPDQPQQKNLAHTHSSLL